MAKKTGDDDESETSTEMVKRELGPQLQAPVGDEGEETALARLNLVEVELTDEACCERCMGPEGCCDLCGGILRDGMVSDGGSLCLRCAGVGEEPVTGSAHGISIVSTEAARG